MRDKDKEQKDMYVCPSRTMKQQTRCKADLSAICNNAVDDMCLKPDAMQSIKDGRDARCPSNGQHVRLQGD